MKLGLKVIAPGVVGLGAAGIACASTVAQSLGVAGLLHSSGAAILSSVGVGGSGYIAGTIGGAAATGFLVASAPLVIGTAAAVALGGIGVAVRNILK